MAAPAIKLRPAPIRTIALTAGSALPRATFSTMPSGTPGLSALTGGLSTVMTPIPSTFSKRTRVPSAISCPPSLQRRLGAEDDRALRRQHAAIAMCDGGRAIGDLARPAFVAQLSRRFDQQKQPVHAGVAIGQAAAIGVDRQAALRGNAAVGDKAAALALGTGAKILEEEDRVDREGVVEVDDIDLAGTEPRHVVGG